MSPHIRRQELRRSATPLSKSYDRPVAQSLDNQLLLEATDTCSLPDTRSRPGFPTYAEYKSVEKTYLSSLSQNKRAKALITQQMFDTIWDLLHDPQAPIGSAQFRFWVRKMFVLDETSQPNGGKPIAVVLHQNKPVAIVEQLYDLLCYSHDRANHGGRDRTTAAVKQEFSWVPKELIAKFVKACPTCSAARSSDPLVRASARGKALVKSWPGELPNARDAAIKQDSAAAELYYLAIPNSIHNVDSAQGIRSIQSVNSWLPSNGPLDVSALECSHHDGHPMLYGLLHSPSRSPRHYLPYEAPLSDIPDGWEYFVGNPDTYPAHLDAHAIDQADRQLGDPKRPRMPGSSISSDGRIEKSSGSSEHDLIKSAFLGDGQTGRLTLPPLMKALSEGVTGSSTRINFLRSQSPSLELLPGSLQPYLLDEDSLEHADVAPYVPEIDPALLIESGESGVLGWNEYEEEGTHVQPDGESSLSGVQLGLTAPTPTKTTKTRRAPPPPLDLVNMSNLNPARLIDFMSHRNVACSLSPASAGASSSGPDSAPSSASSLYSQVSPFLGPGHATRESSASPNTTCTPFPSPADVVDQSKELAPDNSTHQACEIQLRGTKLEKQSTHETAQDSLESHMDCSF